MMSNTTRLISSLTLLLAVLLPSIALFVFDSKNLARVILVLVLVVGYGFVFLRIRAGR
jgi:hypothetical protein